MDPIKTALPTVPPAPPAAPPPPRRALQITRILEDAGVGDANQGSRILVFGIGQRGPLRVSAQWVSENLPAVGGYYIEEGGHARYSAK